MADRLIEDERSRKLLVRYIENQKLPFVCTIIQGKHRSVSQNRLQRMWLNEIAEQKGDVTPEQVRGYCKLTIGVPILRASHEKFREAYDRILKPLSHEQKLALMQEPLDLPVTRLFTVKQKSQFLDEVAQHFAEQGVVLTQPDAMGWAA